MKSIESFSGFLKIFKTTNVPIKMFTPIIMMLIKLILDIRDSVKKETFNKKGNNTPKKNSIANHVPIKIKAFIKEYSHSFSREYHFKIKIPIIKIKTKSTVSNTKLVNEYPGKIIFISFFTFF